MHQLRRKQVDQLTKNSSIPLFNICTLVSEHWFACLIFRNSHIVFVPKGQKVRGLGQSPRRFLLPLRLWFPGQYTRATFFGGLPLAGYPDLVTRPGVANIQGISGGLRNCQCGEGFKFRKLGSCKFLHVFFCGLDWTWNDMVSAPIGHPYSAYSFCGVPHWQKSGFSQARGAETKVWELFEGSLEGSLASSPSCRWDLRRGRFFC